MDYAISLPPNRLIIEITSHNCKACRIELTQYDKTGNKSNYTIFDALNCKTAKMTLSCG